MRSHFCFDAPTEGATGGLLSSPTPRCSKAKAAPKRRPSAAKNIIRAEVPKDTGPKDDGARILLVFGLLKPRKSFSERHILLDGPPGTPLKLLRPFYEPYKSLGLDSFHF